jgi:hypothetical protein
MMDLKSTAENTNDLVERDVIRFERKAERLLCYCIVRFGERFKLNLATRKDKKSIFNCSVKVKLLVINSILQFLCEFDVKLSRVIH